MWMRIFRIAILLFDYFFFNNPQFDFFYTFKKVVHFEVFKLLKNTEVEFVEFYRYITIFNYTVTLIVHLVHNSSNAFEGNYN